MRTPIITRHCALTDFNVRNTFASPCIAPCIAPCFDPFIAKNTLKQHDCDFLENFDCDLGCGQYNIEHTHPTQTPTHLIRSRLAHASATANPSTNIQPWGTPSQHQYRTKPREVGVRHLLLNFLRARAEICATLAPTLTRN